MPPGSAMPSRRAAMLTLSPRMSSPSARTSPTLMPTRNSILRSGGSSIAAVAPRCTATAQRTASTALANSTRMPSPMIRTMRPRCAPISGSISSFRKARSRAKELIDPEIGAHRGRIVRIMGDGILVEFASAVDAVRCAVAVQRGATAAIDEPPERRIEFRVGINVGDVLADGDDILGDSVNIAARLEGIAEPGGICLSAAAYEQVRGKLEIAVDDMGEQDLKNIARPLRTYRVVL